MENADYKCDVCGRWDCNGFHELSSETSFDLDSGHININYKQNPLNGELFKTDWDFEIRKLINEEAP